MDLAIVGEGFFAVRSSASNDILYTRQGQFQRDDAGRVVTATGLALQAEDGGDVVLDQANAVAGNFFASAVNGSVTFHNSGAVNVGAVSAATVSAGLVQGNGITASIAAGSFVSLRSDSGTIGQDAAAAARIVGGELRAATSGKDVTLTNASNQLVSVGDLTGANLAVADSVGGLLVAGTIVASGQGELAAAGGGTLTQTSGTICAQSHIAIASNGDELVQAGNDVATVAGSSGTGTFRYRDATAVTIGALTGTGGGVTGVSASGKDITIVAGAGGAAGGIAVNAIVNASSGTVRLQTSQGDITQATNAAITAGALLANAANGSVDLGGSTNAVTSVAGTALGSVRAIRA